MRRFGVPTHKPPGFSSRLSALLLIGLALPSGCFLSRAEPDPSNRVAGTVVRPDDGCSQALVVLCDGQTGVPLNPETLLPFTDETNRDFKVWQTVPDADGKFCFTNVPPGRYLVAAQAWKRDLPATNLFDLNGETLHLLGRAETVVPSTAATELRLAAPGDGGLRCAQEFPNDDCYLLLGTQPTMGDAILGFPGWGTNFTRHLVGFNRMTHGRTTVHGLAGKEVNAAIFCNDNSPGFGAAALAVGAEEPVRMPIVAGWSDAQHDPPPELAGLVELFEQKKITLQQAIGYDPRRERSDAGNIWRRMAARLRPILENEVVLPDGRKARVADLVAADAYARLRASTGK